MSMERITKEELLEMLFHDDYEHLKGKKLRMTRVRVLVAADVAMKSADVQIGFMDRFCGSLILTGGLSQVQTAVEEVVRFFDQELGFKVCAVHKS